MTFIPLFLFILEGRALLCACPGHNAPPIKIYDNLNKSSAL